MFLCISMLISQTTSHMLFVSLTLICLIITLCIAISDDGTGLSNEIVNPQAVFEKGVTTTNGSGLGLYNVALIVEKQLSGKITVDDSYKATDKNKGFKLLITL